MKKGLRVQVHDNSVEKALRKLKKKLTDSGKLQEVRDRQEFVKPTTERKIKAGQAKSRWKKHLRSQSLPPKMY